MLESLFGFIHLLCDAASNKTLPKFRKKIDIQSKSKDIFDPVTLADKEAEIAVRALIIKKYIDHGIICEEYSNINPEAYNKWIIDPVDGTRAFISGIPVWGTLIGFASGDKFLLGAIEQPFTGERYICDGKSSWLYYNGTRSRLTTSGITQLHSATIITTSPKQFRVPYSHGYEKLESRCRLARYGLDCYGYAMVASGHADLAVESGLKIYDIAAVIPIIQQAGGVVTDWQGEEISVRRPFEGNVIVAANKNIHTEAVTLLN